MWTSGEANYTLRGRLLPVEEEESVLEFERNVLAGAFEVAELIAQTRKLLQKAQEVAAGPGAD